MSPTSMAEDRVRHGFQGIYVIHLQPLQHHPLHAGLREASETVDDLVWGPRENGGREMVPRISVELVVHLSLGTAEDDAGHQGSTHLFWRSPGLVYQPVEPRVEILERLRLQEDGVPFVRVAGRQRQSPTHAIAPYDHRRSSGPRRARHEHGLSKVVELAVERHGLIVAEQTGHDLEPLLEAGEAPVSI
jgi:hypothetical protein